MGFFDAIKGFGTSIFETLTQGVSAVAPSFVEAGAAALFQNLFPTQRPAGQQVFTQRAALGPMAQFQQQLGPLFLPGQTGGRGIFPPTFGQDVFRNVPAQPSPRLGLQQTRTAMPHFPSDTLNVTQALAPAIGLGLGALGAGLGAAGQFFDIPGVDLQLPFRADARTGGNAFFHGVGQVGQRPRSLIMQMNPSSGTPTFFRHAGRPIMFSGDRTLCKNIEKIARRAGRPRSRR